MCVYVYQEEGPVALCRTPCVERGISHRVCCRTVCLHFIYIYIYVYVYVYIYISRRGTSGLVPRRVCRTRPTVVAPTVLKEMQVRLKKQVFFSFA